MNSELCSTHTDSPEGGRCNCHRGVIAVDQSKLTRVKWVCSVARGLWRNGEEMIDFFFPEENVHVCASRCVD